MRNICQKLKTWYRGQTLYSIGQMIGQADNRERGIKHDPIPPVFEPPLIARILNAIWRFFAKHGKWLITTGLIAMGVYLTYLQVTKTK